MKDSLLTPTLTRFRLASTEHDRLVNRLSMSLASEKNILFAYAFGSFIEDRPFGDVDVAVFLDDSISPPTADLDVQLTLAARLEGEIHLPVDIVILNRAPLGLRIAAIRGRLLFSQDEERRLYFMESTCLQAMDTACLRRQSLMDLLSDA